MFDVLCDLPEKEAENILKGDELWRADGTYLRARKAHEKKIREAFIAAGGKPEREFPIYMILGDSNSGAHNISAEYPLHIKIPLSIFKPEEISFTYPDSLYEVPLDNLGRIQLERSKNPTVYRIEELEEMIQRYQVYKYNNHYVEAQVWTIKPLLLYVSDYDTKT